MKKFRTVLSGIQLFLFLVLNVKKNEQIIIYHTPAIITPITLARKIRKFKVIVEVEEIYSKVWEDWNRKCSYEKEIKYLKSADKYILVSENLRNLFEPKKSIVLHGSYNFANHEKRKKKSEFIEVVYAGTIDNMRKAAENAVLCAEYLPKNYRVHILGKGDEATTLELVRNINKVNLRKNYECCIYHGVKVGEELNKLMNTFDIAINSQIIGKYMDTAFPSKIFFYLSFNLRVISTKISNIENSIISKYIDFADDDTPEEIAKAIMTINVSERINTRNALEELDHKFTSELGELIGEYN